MTKSAWEKLPFKEKHSYDVVVREKPKCRPSRPIPPNGTCVQVPLQNVVNHTVDRILLDLGIIEHVKELKAKHGSVEIQFIHKLGMDGSKQHPGGHHVHLET